MTDEELADIEDLYVRFGDEIPTCRDHVLALVALLKSERRLRVSTEAANQVLRENATWNEEDADRLELVENALHGILDAAPEHFKVPTYDMCAICSHAWPCAFGLAAGLGRSE